MADRYHGHCCRSFVVRAGTDNPLTLAEVHENWRAWRAGDKLDAHGRAALYDIDLVGPMLRPAAPDADGSPRFTCAHLQANGDCGIYEMRPMLCRDYPGAQGCSFDGCTWDRVRLPHAMRPSAEAAAPTASAPTPPPTNREDPPP